MLDWSGKRDFLTKACFIKAVCLIMCVLNNIGYKDIQFLKYYLAATKGSLVFGNTNVW